MFRVVYLFGWHALLSVCNTPKHINITIVKQCTHMCVGCCFFPLQITFYNAERSVSGGWRRPTAWLDIWNCDMHLRTSFPRTANGVIVIAGGFVHTPTYGAALLAFNARATTIARPNRWPNR